MKTAKKKALVLEKTQAIRAQLAAGASLDSVAALHGGLKDSGLLTQSAGFVPSLGAEPRLSARRSRSSPAPPPIPWP